MCLQKALEMGGLELRADKAEAIQTTSMKSIVSLMGKKVDPNKAEGVEGTLVLHFVDTQVHLDNG